MVTTRMHAADFWTSIGFFILGVYMAFTGVGMPGAGGLIEEGGEPGRVPIILGAIIALLSMILLVRSVLAGGYRMSGNRIDDPAERSGLWRCAVTAAGCSLYAVGLVGARIGGWHVSYESATILFVFLFVIVAEWPLAADNGARRWRWLVSRWPGLAAIVARIGAPLPALWRPYAWLAVNAAIMAIIVSALVTVVFERYFFVALP